MTDKLTITVELTFGEAAIAELLALAGRFCDAEIEGERQVTVDDLKENPAYLERLRVQLRETPFEDELIANSQGAMDNGWLDDFCSIASLEEAEKED
jgi:hypothetical protein